MHSARSEPVLCKNSQSRSLDTKAHALHSLQSLSYGAYLLADFHKFSSVITTGHPAPDEYLCMALPSF